VKEWIPTMVPQFTAFSKPATFAPAGANAAGAGSQKQNPTRRILGHCKNERQTCLKSGASISVWGLGLDLDT
jgi:hypothetical protein